jgi:hypothetical protein
LWTKPLPDITQNMSASENVQPLELPLDRERQESPTAPIVEFCQSPYGGV